MYKRQVYDTASESALTYEMIRAKEAADENHVDAKTGELVSQNKDEESEKKSQKPVVNFSKAKLADFDYLRQNFYTVDRTTTITGDQLNAEKMLSKDKMCIRDSCKYRSHRIESPYHSINHLLQKLEAFQSVHHVIFILCYNMPVSYTHLNPVGEKI